MKNKEDCKLSENLTLWKALFIITLISYLIKSVS